MGQAQNHLAILERRQLRQARRTDHFVVAPKRVDARLARHLEALLAVGVAGTEMLPRCIVDAVQRSFERPGSGTWRNGRLDEDEHHLVDLCEGDEFKQKTRII